MSSNITHTGTYSPLVGEPVALSLMYALKARLASSPTVRTKVGTFRPRISPEYRSVDSDITAAFSGSSLGDIFGIIPLKFLSWRCIAPPYLAKKEPVPVVALGRIL